MRLKASIHKLSLSSGESEFSRLVTFSHIFNNVDIILNISYSFLKGLVVIDISDPANPTKLGSYDTAGYAIGVTLSSNGKKAYVADGDNGLVVIDVSDPANPTKLGLYDTTGYALGVTLSSDNTKAYVADRNIGLTVIDIGLIGEDL